MSTVKDAPPRSAADESLYSWFPAREADDLATYGHRQLIGYAGFALPFLLYLIARWRPTPPLEPGKLLNSLSAYYYTSAVVVQVGILSALAAFFFTYQGYKNARDGVAAIIAGSAALLVALFPTTAPLSSMTPEWWTPWIGRIHYAAGVIQFGGFIVFALVLFPKSNVTPGKPFPREKQVRNGIYQFCGWGMVVFLLWAAIAIFVDGKDASILIPETGAVWLFAISWLAKGRAHHTINAARKRTIRYVRNPRQKVNEEGRAVHS
jgi:hypothetical protein